MSQETPSGSSLWARLPPPVWAATGAAVTIAILGSALGLFRGHRAAPPAHTAPAPAIPQPAIPHDDAADAETATVRLQITTVNGPLLSAKDLRVLIDGSSVDARKRFPLKPGTHQLQVTAAGYARYSQQVNAAPGDHLEVPIQLRQASPDSKETRKRVDSKVASAAVSSPPRNPSSSATVSPKPQPPPPAPPAEPVQPAVPPVAARNAIHLACTGHGTALQAGSIHRKDFVEGITLELPDPQTGRAHLPEILIPAIHGSVSNGWVKLTHVTVTSKDITATFSFNYFEHPAIRVDRQSGTLTISGWAEDFTGHCKP